MVVDQIGQQFESGELVFCIIHLGFEFYVKLRFYVFLEKHCVVFKVCRYFM